jgi:hypothetical protein
VFYFFSASVYTVSAKFSGLKIPYTIRFIRETNQLFRTIRVYLVSINCGYVTMDVEYREYDAVLKKFRERWLAVLIF